MERILLRREEYYEQIEMIKMEKKIKLRKAKQKENRKKFQKNAMNS